MTDSHPIREQQIEERNIPQSFAKGEEYYYDPRVSNCVRRGTTLEASVQGSQFSPYQVEIEMDEEGKILTTSCTCPYDWGGDCKHIVAVLLTWKEQPDQFQEKKFVEDLLKHRSREELKALVELMLERDPSLRSLLENEVPGSVGESKELKDPDAYRGEVINILEAYRGYGHEPHIANLLQSLLERARRHARSKEYGHVYGICRAVVEEVLEMYEMTHDEGALSVLFRKTWSCSGNACRP